MDALNFEYFVRKAFGCMEKDEDCMINKGDDPAGLADAYIFNSSSLSKLKICTGYAIAIYNHFYMNKTDLCKPIGFDYLDGFLDRVLNATRVEDIRNIIIDYQKFQSDLGC